MSDAYSEYIEEFSIEIADFNLIGPIAYIPLPETLPKRNNRIINIQNDDDWCFRWSVLEALHPVKIHPERNLHQLYGGFIEELNMEDIPIPVPVSTPVYKKFEENNPEISPDALEKFVTKIEEELANIQEDLSAPAEMIMALGDLVTYNKATDCWICKGPFIKPSPEVLQQFEEAKHRLLELKEWEACMEKDHPEKKKIQKGYQEALKNTYRGNGMLKAKDVLSPSSEHDPKTPDHLDSEDPKKKH
ncbi:11001_t:CDS:2, partial [Racocetra fulgida]